MIIKEGNDYIDVSTGEIVSKYMYDKYLENTAPVTYRSDLQLTNVRNPEELKELAKALGIEPKERSLTLKGDVSGLTMKQIQLLIDLYAKRTYDGHALYLKSSFGDKKNLARDIVNLEKAGLVKIYPCEKKYLHIKLIYKRKAVNTQI